MMINTWIAMYLFIKLAVIVARELGVPIAPAEEIDFYPLRFINIYILYNNIENYCNFHAEVTSLILTVTLGDLTSLFPTATTPT